MAAVSMSSLSTTTLLRVVSGVGPMGPKAATGACDVPFPRVVVRCHGASGPG